MKNRLVSTWQTVDQLTGQVAIAIMKAKNEIPRPGWQKGFVFDEISLRRDMMALQKENENLQQQLSEAKKTIDSLTVQDNIAFDECEIPLIIIFITKRTLLQLEKIVVQERIVQLQRCFLKFFLL